MAQHHTSVPSASQDIITLSLLVSSADKLVANSLDPDQVWQNVGPDLHSNCMTLMVIFE